MRSGVRPAHGRVLLRDGARVAAHAVDAAARAARPEGAAVAAALPARRGAAPAAALATAAEPAALSPDAGAARHAAVHRRLDRPGRLRPPRR